MVSVTIYGRIYGISDSEQEDRLGTLFGILEHLPPGLRDWFEGAIRSFGNNRSHVEVEVSSVIRADKIFPGDLVVRKYRDPKKGDLVEAGIRGSDGNYSVMLLKIVRVKAKDGLVYVEDPYDSESRGNVGINQILWIIERIHEYESAEWKKLVKALDIDIDKDEIATWIQQNIEYLEEAEAFLNKDGNLAALKKRLKQLEKR